MAQADDEDAVRAMLLDVPTCDRAIVIFPVDTQSGCRWYGMSPEAVVDLLYRVADQILEQRVPLKKRVPKIPPGK